MTRIIIMATVFTTVLSISHYFIWRRLVKNTNIKNKSRKLLTYFIIFLGVFIPISYITARFIPYKISFYSLWFANLWLGMMMLFMFSFLFIDIIRGALKLFKIARRDKTVKSPERKEFIAKSIGAGVTTLVLGTTALSIKNFYEMAIVKKVKISLDNLPKSFKGFRIAQISDIHIGQIMRKHTLVKIVEQVNSLNADIIVITGDLVDGSVENLFDEISPIKDLKAKYGVYFITGNHEYYSGAEQWTDAVTSLGIKVLQNENVEIKKNGESFFLVGVNDREAGKFGEKHSPDFKKAFSGINKDKKTVLLAHQPHDIEKAAEFNADLMLSGHTHGGQIWPFGLLVTLQQKYLKGYYKYEKTHLYVNQGTGCWGPPMRLDSENEITEITLT